MEMTYKLTIMVILSVLISACGDDGNDTNQPPPITAQYGIYGTVAGDFNLSYEGLTLVGTSDDDTSFDVSSYERFIIYVPSTSEKILFDAIGLDNMWVNSIAGVEYAHYTSNVNPTGSSWQQSDSYIEGPPDGLTIENTVGRDGFYSFSTLGATTLTVYVQ